MKKWTDKEVSYLKDNYALFSNPELALKLKRTASSIEKKASKLGFTKDNASVDDMAEYFAKVKENLSVKKQLKRAIEENLKLKKENEAVVNLKKKYTTSKIKEIKGDKKEAVPIIQISDWHIDEKITLQQTNGLNEFNLDIAKYRADKLAVSIVKIIRDNWSKTFNINKAVIQLGGDFIGGNIHEELMESNTLSVMTASIEAQNMLASLLIFLQKNLPHIKFTAVCNIGNHCVDEYTEILTDNGFVKAKDIEENNIIASFIKETGKITYDKIVGIERFSANKGIHLYGTKKDELVTDEHNLVINREFVKAKDYEEINGVNFRYSGQAEHDDIKFSKDRLSLLTWVIMDATMVYRHGHIHHIQFKLSKQRKIDEIERLLNKLGVKYTKQKATMSGGNILQPYMIRIYGKYARQIASELNDKKEFPKWFTNLSRQKILSVVETISITDGYKRKNGYIEWSSINKNNVDVIQIACIKNSISFSYKKTDKFIGGYKSRNTLYIATIVIKMPPNITNVKKEIINEKINFVGIQSVNGTLITRRNGKVNFTGNSRTTRKPRISTEAGNSLETYLYANLQYNFPNIEFIINDSYHKYLDILGFKCRFHHGHAIRYGGGIGGIFISAYKKISQWNKARAVDYDFFGHFHQCKDGGNFMCNGSLVGYNSFAIRIGADYETPKQMMSLITSGRGLTTTWKISL